MTHEGDSRGDLEMERLVATIRQEVARQRAASRPLSPARRELEPRGAPAVAPAVDASLKAAERQARIATFVPDWPHWSGVRRRLGRAVARAVLRLSVFITNQQREFNLAIVHSVAETGGALRHLEARLRQGETSLALLEDRHADLEDRHADQAAAHEATAKALEQTAGRLARLDGQVPELERQLLQLTTAIRVQEHRLQLLLEEARRRLPAPFDADQLGRLAAEADRMHESFYVGLQERFRGRREEVAERLRVYLPLVKAVGPGPALDLGCGRGEWLELLRDEGLTARGVDTSAAMVEQCRARQLDVVQDEALAHLRGLPDASLAVVTGFHVIEHLPFDDLIRLVDETVRVLRPGGLAIYETPNPANLLVGSCNFYQDPTHRAPIPVGLAQHLAESRGLCRVRIMPLHPYADVLRLEGSAVADRVSEHFYGPQDYAVIGYRA